MSVAGTVLQSTLRPAQHITRQQLTILIVGALLIHAGIAWYLTSHHPERLPTVHKSELSIELVRPPPPPPKIEPPKPAPPKPQVEHAQVLPQIQESISEPQTNSEGAEAPIALAPIASGPVAEELPITAPVGRAGYLNNPPPDYPAVAVRQHWQGSVLLRVRVLSDGKVESIEIKESSGRKVLDDEAVRTVRRWLFTPSKRGETAIDGWATVPIEFLLD